jgi:REP element-mobilizing transposase RayT
MGRPLRVEDPSCAYHVTARGNDGRDVYLDAVDRRMFLSLLGRATLEHRWTVLGYCLMTNHYHLLLEIPRGGLSAGMRELNGGYSRWANRRHARSGHLFRNRFGAARIDRDSHLLEACRYVVLNPVRAGLCPTPRTWRWSSYRACAGLEPAPRFLALATLLQLFGADLRRAQASFRSFVDDATTG